MTSRQQRDQEMRAQRGIAILYMSDKGQEAAMFATDERLAKARAGETGQMPRNVEFEMGGVPVKAKATVAVECTRIEYNKLNAGWDAGLAALPRKLKKLDLDTLPWSDSDEPVPVTEAW